MKMEKAGPLKSLLGQTVALLVFLAVGVGAGRIFWQFFLTSYEASTIIILPRNPDAASSNLPYDPELNSSTSTSVRLPDGPSFFRQIEPILGSTTTIENFAKSRGLTESPIVTRFVDQTRSRTTGVASFAFSYGINRADARDLPDAVASEVLKQSPIRFAIVVRTTDKDEAEAGRAEKIIIEYVRDTALRVAISSTMQQFSNYARTEISKIDMGVSSIRIRVASLNRQISNLEKIRALYGEGASAGTDVVTIPDLSSRSESRRYLSPVRQLVAYRSEHLELMEKEGLALSRRAALEALDRYVTAVQGRTEAEAKATTHLEIALKSLDMMAAPSGSPDEMLAFANERAIVNGALVWLRAYLVDQQPEPAEPIVYRIGPPRFVATGAFVILGFILWLVFVRRALSGLWR